MSTIDIKKHREAAAKATPSDWGVGFGGDFVFVTDSTNNEIMGDNLRASNYQPVADAEFICLIRNEHTEMLNELERLREQVKRLAEENYVLTNRVG